MRGMSTRMKTSNTDLSASSKLVSRASCCFTSRRLRPQRDLLDICADLTPHIAHAHLGPQFVARQGLVAQIWTNVGRNDMPRRDEARHCTAERCRYASSVCLTNSVLGCPLKTRKSWPCERDSGIERSPARPKNMSELRKSDCAMKGGPLAPAR